MMLHIVSTPIGNLKDTSVRVTEILKQVDFIIAEDTRTTGKLLKHLGISKGMLSYNDQNKQRRTAEVIERLKAGQSAALVSENGTPLISDPGYFLVREAIHQGIKLSPIPGPSALLAALVVSGAPPDQFTFVGFLPKGPGKKQTLLKKLAKESRTFICYESPHRILKTLATLKEVLPDWNIAICRELTKLHEEVIRGKVKDITFDNPRGEFVLVLSRQ